MEVHEMIQQVKSKEDFIVFVSRLLKDLENNRDEWKNPTLERFLEAMGAWVTDSKNVPHEPTWMTLANILYASKIYE
ncbi:DUF7660 family protein [Paenibacillus taihuensis]|uniref:DUF7660 family protein n=1 Tax=Paenibacillus taihuensis TaxID=1156355 RepID=UPI000E220B02|nr:hypothetical protein [Paenibacillus taihuensis]